MTEATERDERASRAVRAFRKMQPTLSSYAQAITGRADVRVVLSRESAMTDGKLIHLRPPLALGDELQHDRRLCDKRDKDTRLQMCPACAIHEQVMINLYHEIGHITGGSFEEISEGDRLFALEAAVQELGHKKQLEAAKKVVRDQNLRDFLNLAAVINPYLPTLVNAVEDARVDGKMCMTRKGIRVMLQASSNQIFRDGVEDNEGNMHPWTENPLNAQVSIACMLRIVGYEGWESYLHPDVVRHTAMPEIADLLEKLSNSRTASDTFRYSYPLMEALRKYGYFQKPEEIPDLPSSPDDDNEEDSSDNDSSDDEDGKNSSENSGNSESKSEEKSSDSKETKSESSSDQTDDSSGDDSTEGGGDEVDEDSDSSGSDSQANEESQSDSDSGSSDPSSTDAGVDSKSDSDSNSTDDDGDSPEPEGYDPASESSSSAPDRDAGEGRSGESDGTEDDDSSSGTGSDASDSEVPDQDSTASEDGDGNSDDTDTGSTPPSENPEQEGSNESSRDSGTSPDEGEASEADRTGGEASEADNPERVEDESEDSESLGDGGEDPGDGVPETGADGQAGTDSTSDTGSPEANSSTGDATADESPGVPDSGSDDPAPNHEHGVDGQPCNCGTCQTYGTPDQVTDLVDQVHARLDQMDETDKGTDDHDFTVVIIQAQYFDMPSQEVEKVEIWRDGPRFFSTAKPTIVLEEHIGPALLATRRTFSDNLKADPRRNLKRGRVNPGVLGRRAWAGDPRLFKQAKQPGERDYSVLIGIDLSSSSIGHEAEMIRLFAIAQAELCHRTGVRFAVYGHSGGGYYRNLVPDDSEIILQLDIIVIKEFNEPWSDECKTRMTKVKPSGGNLDGHTLEYYRKRLDEERTTDRIIMYYTDGAMPYSNFDEELQILQREIKTCKRRGYIEMAVGIGTDSPVEHGFDTVMVNDFDDIQKVVTHLGKRLSQGR